jgi:hypothetical protein
MSDALALFHGEGEAFTEEDPPNLAITEETRANVAALCAAAIAEKLQRGSGIGTNDPIGGFGGGAVGGGGGADDGRAYADGAGGGGDGGAPATKRAKTGAAGSAEGGGDGRHEFGTWSEGDDSARLGRAVVGAKPMTQEPAGPKTADADEVLPPGWRVEEKQRRTSSLGGEYRVDRYYIAPDETRCRSMPEVYRHVAKMISEAAEAAAGVATEAAAGAAAAAATAGTVKDSEGGQGDGGRLGGTAKGDGARHAVSTNSASHRGAAEFSSSSVAMGSEAASLMAAQSSQFTGVSWNKRIGKWQVDRNVDGKHYYGGSYADEEKAARMSDAIVLVFRGKDAPLNMDINEETRENMAKIGAKDQAEEDGKEGKAGATSGREDVPGENGSGDDKRRRRGGREREDMFETGDIVYSNAWDDGNTWCVCLRARPNATLLVTCLYQCFNTLPPLCPPSPSPPLSGRYRAIILESPGSGSIRVKVDFDGYEGYISEKTCQRQPPDGVTVVSTPTSSSTHSSTFTGVSWIKARHKWKANIRVRGANCYGGSFEHEEEAARMSDALALVYRGEHWFTDGRQPNLAINDETREHVTKLRAAAKKGEEEEEENEEGDEEDDEHDENEEDEEERANENAGATDGRNERTDASTTARCLRCTASVTGDTTISPRVPHTGIAGECYKALRQRIVRRQYRGRDVCGIVVTDFHWQPHSGGEDSHRCFRVVL